MGKFPFTLLDQPNPWFDKLRAGIHDHETDRIILSTSEGFYYSDNLFSHRLKKFKVQPPVSVMGINAFEKLNNGGFLVGSFSGLFSWFPDHNYVGDAVSGMEFIPVAATGPPIAENAITGLVWNADGLPWIFDYSEGAKPLQHHKQFSQMPQKIIENTPISLWNLALEFHTARVYGTLFGDFYILIIPLAGLSILFIIISGYWMYRKKFRT